MAESTRESIRIGGASGFWGDASASTPQLLAGGELDYLVYDFLAEITMSIMARARQANPEAGFATDFVGAMLRPHLAEVQRQGVKVISNAGGVNPVACAEAVRACIREAGLSLKVATVLGDDLIDRSDQLAGQQHREMFSGQAFPDPQDLLSINAYLGAFPIAQALRMGADIVITGRGVDSAVTLGACIHAFGWQPDDWNLLASGSLAGHLLECGAQATGGNFTDWELVVDSSDEIGYPVVQMRADGSFACGKPPGTGGLVSPGTLGEQMLYEIGDPQAYALPDVVCDFSQVTLRQAGPDLVEVQGALGHPAPDTYKVCATFADGWRGGLTSGFYGHNSAEKARRHADAVLRRARSSLRARNLPDFTETSVEVVGAESQFGATAEQRDYREVVLKLAARHPSDKGIGILLKEFTGMALSSPPGLSGFAGGRPRPSPVARLFSFLLPKEQVQVQVQLDEGEPQDFAEAPGAPFSAQDLERPQPPAAPTDAGPQVPLRTLAYGRSGDKGDAANVAVMARDPAYLPYIWAALDEAAVARHFAHFLQDPQDPGAVQRFLLPGSHSVNFLLQRVLGGGGVASLRYDPQGKGYAQLLLEHPIPVSAQIAERLGQG